MPLEGFKETCRRLAPGNAAHLNYETFENLSPPGVENDSAKERAYKFAKSMAALSITVPPAMRYCSSSERRSEAWQLVATPRSVRAAI
jgi:hypothetical protein